MLQTRVHDGQTSADSSLQHGAVARSTLHRKIRKPAVMLVFLLAVSGVTAVAVRNSAQSSSEIPFASHEVEGSKNLSTAENEALVGSESSSDAATFQQNTSVELESNTTNGVTNTRLEVNGEEVPVKPNSSTSVTVDNDNQTVTNVTTQNTQTSGNGFNFNSNTSSSNSSSFSHSFNYKNNVGESN